MDEFFLFRERLRREFTMENTDINEQYSSLSSCCNLDYESKQNHKQLEQNKTKTTSNLAEQDSYQLGVLIFIIAMITIYGFGIHQLSKTVIDIVETVVEEVDKDYRFRIF
ncbi:MAG: hypothetical protein QNJ60_03020 [Xenococcaceae cyanobacterium MO_188.B19]|nr:hypothetical protein [Xenococcaceae cyanobacterium MO_188.B19]